MKSTRATETLLAVGGLFDEEAKTMEYYDADTDVWNEIANFDFDRRFYGSIILNDKLVLVGGEKEGIWVTDVNTYDFETGEFGKLASMSLPVYNQALAVLDGYLYIIGGMVAGISARDELSIVERYDPTTDKWEVMPEMASPRRKCAAVAFDGELFVFGGYFEGYPLSDVAAFNPTTRTWRTCTSMIEKRNGLSVAASGNYIYAFGGHNGIEYIKGGERYDPASNTWSLIAEANWTRSLTESANFNNSIMVAGGICVENDLDYCNFVETYNPDTNEFQKIASTNQIRVYFGLLNVPWELIKKAIDLKDKSPSSLNIASI